MIGEPLDIHTSDIATYKRCRRKWDWGSRIRGNLVVVDQPANPAFWLGSGIHFALEDWEGYNRFGDPRKALIAYAKAYKKSELPDAWDTWLELGDGMLEHYVERWLPLRGRLPTYWLNGEPQVEVHVQVPLGLWMEMNTGTISEGEDPPKGAEADGALWREVVYDLSYDRVVIDEHDRLLIEDYKTAKDAFDTARLELDAQISRYYWSGRLMYGPQLEGAVWTQLIKHVPRQPEYLEKSKRFSLDKRISTTHAMYLGALEKHYGRGEVPELYLPLLNELASKETFEGDAFIRRNVIYRNEDSAISEERKLHAEVREILRAWLPADHPNALPLYNNPTRDCSWDCPFRAPCMATDDGGDAESILEDDYEQWEGLKDDWRDRIVWPKAKQGAKRA